MTFSKYVTGYCVWLAGSLPIIAWVVRGEISPKGQASYSAITKSSENKLKADVLLPPANEVWGKVMFLHLSVILFTCVRGWLTSMQHWSHDQPPGWWSASRGGGVCVRGGVWANPAPTGTRKAVRILLELLLITGFIIPKNFDVWLRPYIEVLWFY